MGFKEKVLVSTAIFTVIGIGAGSLSFVSNNTKLSLVSGEKDVVVERPVLSWEETPAFDAFVGLFNRENFEGFELKDVKYLMSPSAITVSCMSGIPGANGSVTGIYSSGSSRFEVTLPAG